MSSIQRVPWKTVVGVLLSTLALYTNYPRCPVAHFAQRPRPSPQHRPGPRSLGSHLKARGFSTRGTWRWAMGAYATPARNAGSSPWPWTSARISAHLPGASTSGHIRPDVAVPRTGQGPRGPLRDGGPRPPRWAGSAEVPLRSAPPARPLPAPGGRPGSQASG